MNGSRYLRLSCNRCGTSHTGELETTLRNGGLLKRQPRPSLDYMWQLLPAVQTRLRCPSCGAEGSLQPSREVEPDGEDWPEARGCESCGRSIPPERLELFPQETRCAACRAAEPARPTDDASYCPRCGGLMVERTRNSRGVTRYVEYCPSCRR